MPQPLLFAVQELLQKYARPREAAALRLEEALSRRAAPGPLARVDAGAVRGGPVLQRLPFSTASLGADEAGLPGFFDPRPMVGTRAPEAPLRGQIPLPGMSDAPLVGRLPLMGDEGRLSRLPTPIDPALLGAPNTQLDLPMFAAPARMDPRSRAFPRMPEADPRNAPDRAETLGALDYVRQLVGATDRGVQRFPRTQEGPWDTVALTERRIPGPPTEAGVVPTADVKTRLINKGDLFRAVDSRGPGLFFSGQVEVPSADERLYAIGSGSERNPERRVNLPQSEQDVAYNRQPYTVARGGTMVDALIDGEPGDRQLPEETPLAIHRVIRNMIDSTLANGRTLKVPGAESDVRLVTQYRGQPLPPDTVGLPVMRPGEIRSVSQPLAPLSGDPFGYNAEKQGPSWQRTMGRSSPDPH